MSFNGGYQSDTVTTGSTINGAVFITDITAQNQADNVGGKNYSSSGRVLESCQTSTQLVRVHIWATTGHSNMEPLVIVEQQLVDLTQNEDQSVWTGSIDIDIQDKANIVAIHEDGAMHTCVVLRDQAPQVASALFTGGYPEGQTELKAGDQFQLRVTSNTPFTGVEIANFGALQPKTFEVPMAMESTVSVTIANRGDVAQLLGAKLRVRNENGAFGNYFETADQGTENGIHVLTTNNQHPEIRVDIIHYPAGQQALKNEEMTSLQHVINHFDAVSYHSPTGELSIVNPNTFEAQKQISRIAGDFNIETNNLFIEATRTANGATSSYPLQIQIAHVAPTITLTPQATRFRSGGNNGTEIQSHVLEIASTQPLLNTPVISASEGTLTGEMTVANNEDSHTTYQQLLLVHDNDIKGAHDVTLQSANNLAGIPIAEISGANQYQIGGFVARTITIPAFQRKVSIGTKVTNTGLLAATDKDNAEMSYSPSFANQLLAYTVTDSNGQLNETGDHFYWNDNQAVTNNTTGLATITLEEHS